MRVDIVIDFYEFYEFLRVIDFYEFFIVIIMWNVFVFMVFFDKKNGFFFNKYIEMVLLCASEKTRKNC